MKCWAVFWVIPLRYYFIKWSFLNLWFETLYLCLAAFLTGLAVVKLGDCCPIRWLASITCTLQVAISGSAIILPLAFIYANFGFGSGFCGLSVLTTHGINAIVMLIDIVLSRQRLPHGGVFLATGFMSSYMLFSFLYTMMGGTYEDGKSPYVYAWLDWYNNFEEA